MDFGLENVHVLVTGASGGIGLATARLFLSYCHHSRMRNLSDVVHPELGARVTAHYNTNRAPLDPLLQEHGELRVRAVSGDLSQETAVESLFASASAEPFGPVQVVVVNHARFEERYVPVTQMSLDQWDTTMKTNLTSSFLVVREYMRALEKAGDAVRDTAAIVLVGSNGGKWGAHGHMDYVAAKSAMMYGMCLSLKNEIVKIAPKGRVNVVAPGWVKTPMVKESLKNQDAIYQYLATTSLNKIATPEDIATQIVVLSSSTVSGHVTGQVLMVDGGMEGRVLNKREDI
ncbi:NAD(P)-binding protein [Earliella scabrosa]|nr:NAD(P)-binding protein [Earliella scabrosa]